MPAKGTTFDNELLQFIFNNTTISDLNGISTLYVSLHTANPATTAGAGTVGTQNASEAQYGSYARVAVARTSGGWTVTGSSVSPVATISFPAATGGTETETYFSIGVASSGATILLYYGPISPTINVSNGVTPQIVTSSTITEA